jgi:hypothetical protein
LKCKNVFWSNVILVAGWSCLAKIPELEHCLPSTHNRVSRKMNKLNLPYKLASRGFLDELTEEQKNCLIATFDSNSCEVKKAMIACKKNDGGWDCLAQIPEVEHCLN